MKYKITIEYDGTNLVGWQKQTGLPSAQGLIEDAIYKLSQENVNLTVAGRTDAGVHAKGQVADFNLIKDFGLYSLRQGINFYLHDSPVVILDAEQVANEFSARFSAKKRYYEYIISNRSSAPVLDRSRVWHFPQKLDLELMKKASEFFLGTHDFTSFRASECQAKNPVRTIDEIKIEKTDDYIILNFCAKSFLHHMVRNITGTLVEVGTGKIAYDKIPDIILAKDRKKAGSTSPACGLYFMKVDY
jgi:tRNA pseudouridine38-40 synthase